MPVAATFANTDYKGLSLLGGVARLDTLVTVVDCKNFMRDYCCTDELVGRNELGAEEGDDRTIVQLLVEQVEFANVIVLNKTDLVSAREVARLKGILQKLNPGARVIESQFGKVTPTQLLNTSSFDMNSASMAPGWAQALMGNHHKPETEEYGISSYIFRAERPFHPERLETLMGDFPLPGVLRSKGFAWLAGHTDNAVEWSTAGIHTDLKLGGLRWLAASKHGDRHTELVFIGIDMMDEDIRGALEGALLKPEELARDFDTV
jgi:G3E family GTPase